MVAAGRGQELVDQRCEVLLRAERVVENYSRPEEPASRVGDDASAGDEALEVWIEGDREGVGAVAVLQVEELDGAMRQQRSGSSRRQLYYRDEVPSQGSGSYPDRVAPKRPTYLPIAGANRQAPRAPPTYLFPGRAANEAKNTR